MLPNSDSELYISENNEKNPRGYDTTFYGGQEKVWCNELRKSLQSKEVTPGILHLNECCVVEIDNGVWISFGSLSGGDARWSDDGHIGRQIFSVIGI